MTPPAQKLREYLADPSKTVVLPGVYDGISARVAMSVGFDALYMTGAGTAASTTGHPDLGIAGQDDFVRNANMITDVAGNVPVICDADTGFGGPLNAARTIKMYERAGVAALHIEDQVLPKRCGHLAGKIVVPLEDFLTKIRAVVAARSKGPTAPVIIARTDALQPNGLEDAILRLKAAFAEGAEVAFLEGLRSKEDAVTAIKELAPHPVLLNLATNGTTPNWTVTEAKEMGFKIVIFPLAGICAAAHALRKGYEEIKNEGTDVKTCNGMGPKEFFNVMGMQECIEFDRMAGGKAYK